MEEFFESLVVLTVITLLSVGAIHAFAWAGNVMTAWRRRVAHRRAVTLYMQWTSMPRQVALRNVQAFAGAGDE